MQDQIEGETVSVRSDSVELGLKEGWALYDRPTPKALAGKARNYAKEMFEAGQANRNARVTPESATEKMMQRRSAGSQLNRLGCSLIAYSISWSYHVII